MILVEKAKRLASRGEDVIFIVAFHDKTQHRANNFLCQSLEKQFAAFSNVELWFTPIEDVVATLETLTRTNPRVNLFVDELSFAVDDTKNTMHGVRIALPEASTDFFGPLETRRLLNKLRALRLQNRAHSSLLCVLVRLRL